MARMKGANSSLHVAIHQADEMGNVYTLEKAVRIFWRRREVYVPQGFESDGASVPRFFWRLVFPNSDTKALRAAFAHDYIYRKHPKNWTREEADKMFCDLLIRDGIPKWRSKLAYWGLRLFGWYAWKKQGGK